MIASGSSSYAFADPRGGDRTITVHLHRPASYKADSPVVMVMHGRARNGAEYRDYFVPDADRRGFLVIQPEFSEAHYPNPWAYNYGEMCDADGRVLPRSRWLFPVIDAVFKDVRKRAGSNRGRFFLFGHSAGGQLVHRLTTFCWLDSIERAIAANSGAYTLPVRDENYPFGLGGTEVSDDDLKRVFARPLTIHLGDQDIDPTDQHLPKEPQAMQQGPYRFARGKNYLEVAKREAARLGVPLKWRLAVAPGVAHSGQNMAPFACEVFGL